MFADIMEHWRLAFGGRIDDALIAIRAMHAAGDLGEFEIRGREVFVRVAEYDTIPGVHDWMETHHRYVDVQLVLSGEEAVYWHPTGPELLPRQAYSPERDVELFHTPDAPLGRVILKPGRFAAFFPQDAHCGQGALGAPVTVRKVVLKVDVKLLER